MCALISRRSLDTLWTIENGKQMTSMIREVSGGICWILFILCSVKATAVHKHAHTPSIRAITIKTNVESHQTSLRLKIENDKFVAHSLIFINKTHNSFIDL